MCEDVSMAMVESSHHLECYQDGEGGEVFVFVGIECSWMACFSEMVVGRRFRHNIGGPHGATIGLVCIVFGFQTIWQQEVRSLEGVCSRALAL